MFRLSHDRGDSSNNYMCRSHLKLCSMKGSHVYETHETCNNISYKEKKISGYVYLYPISFAPLHSLLVGSAPGIGGLLSSGMT